MIEGEFIPIFRIHSLFDIQNAIQNPLDGLLVVVDDGGRRCALLVDELLGKQQVVTKSLGAGMGKVKGIAGWCYFGRWTGWPYFRYCRNCSSGSPDSQ